MGIQPFSTAQGERDLIVAVDCSTTASKAVVFDAMGRAVATARSPIATANPGIGLHEQNPEDWWTATRTALRQVMFDVDSSRIRSVTVTTQRETFVCLAADNRPVRPAIVWMDTRARELVMELGSDRVHQISGRPADNTPSIYKIAWLVRNEQPEIQRTDKIGDVGAYLNHRLCRRWVSSVASADSLGLLDMQTRTWSPDLVDLVGIDAATLPEVVAPGTVVGCIDQAVANETALPVGTPIVAGAGDGQCAAIGAGVLHPGSAYLNMGTAVVSGTVSPTYTWDRAYRTVAGADGESFLLEAFSSSGTYLVNWFRERFGVAGAAGQDVTAEELMEAAAAQLPPGAEGLLALPYWNAAQTPYWDPAARGAVVGFTGRHGRAHLYRALLEGIAFEIKLEISGLDSAVSAAPKAISVTGGGSRSAVWMQIVADTLNRPITLCHEPETTALGAAIIGSVAADLHPSLDAASKNMCRSARTIVPDPGNAEKYQELWEIYRGLYDSLKPTLNALSSLR